MRDASDYWYHKVDNEITFENFKCNPAVGDTEATNAFSNTYQGWMSDFVWSNPTLVGF